MYRNWCSRNCFPRARLTNDFRGNCIKSTGRVAINAGGEQHERTNGSSCFIRRIFLRPVVISGLPPIKINPRSHKIPTKIVKPGMDGAGRPPRKTRARERCLYNRRPCRRIKFYHFIEHSRLLWFSRAAVMKRFAFVRNGTGTTMTNGNELFRHAIFFRQARGKERRFH